MQSRTTTTPANRPIAVFDSGVGGLTVLHELLVSLPNEDFIYLGDTANFPYGTKSPQELVALTTRVMQWLLEYQPKLVVVACNSATANALPELTERFMQDSGPQLLGVVTPEAELAVAATKNSKVGVLATPATVASGAYQRTLHGLDPALEITTVSCPDLAPIIQQGFPFDQRVVDTVKRYCLPLQNAAVDTVILGCTHYPLIAPMLQRTLGRSVKLISAGVAMARRVDNFLKQENLQSESNSEGSYSFLCSGDISSFQELGTRFLQLPVLDVVSVGP